MTLDQLPTEMLMQIVSNLSTYREISLVNKRFYAIVCKLTDSKICLQIDQMFCDRFLCDDGSSVLTSNRQISKVKIETFEHFQPQIVAVVKRFSATIKFLSIDAAVQGKFLLKILSLVPNVEHLELQNMKNGNASLKRRCCCAKINFEKLESLSIRELRDDFSGVFNRLPVGVLKKLRISNFHGDALTAVLNRQINIKKLYLGGRLYDKVTTDSFDKLKLESLELNGCETRSPLQSATITAVIISKQTQLKTLKLCYETFVDSRVMSVVADLKDLEVLEMDVAETPVAYLVKIRKLKNLKSLTLRFGHDDCRAKLAILSEWKNNSLITMNLSGNFTVTVDLLGALAKSVPQLKHFTFSPHYTLDENELDEILTHFNFVETLNVSILRTPLADRNHHHHHFNPNLTALSCLIIGNQLYKPWLSNFIAAYPNLKKLELCVYGLGSISLQIGTIVDGFTKLESLILRPRAYEIFVSDLDQFKDHKVNLKFIPVGCVKIAKSTNVFRYFYIVIPILFGLLLIGCVSYLCY